MKEVALTGEQLIVEHRLLGRVLLRAWAETEKRDPLLDPAYRLAVGIHEQQYLDAYHEPIVPNRLMLPFRRTYEVCLD